MIDNGREWFYNTCIFIDKRYLRNTREYRLYRIISQSFQVHRTLITSLFSHTMKVVNGCMPFGHCEHYTHYVHGPHIIYYTFLDLVPSCNLVVNFPAFPQPGFNHHFHHCLRPNPIYFQLQIKSFLINNLWLKHKSNFLRL